MSEERGKNGRRSWRKARKGGEGKFQDSRSIARHLNREKNELKMSTKAERGKYVYWNFVLNREGGGKEVTILGTKRGEGGKKWFAFKKCRSRPRRRETGN